MTANLLAAMGQKAGYPTANDRAKALGISRSHLLHMERGEFRPSPRVVDAMCLAYHKTPEQIERAADFQIEQLATRKIAQVRGAGNV